MRLIGSGRGWWNSQHLQRHATRKSSPFTEVKWSSEVPAAWWESCDKSWRRSPQEVERLFIIIHLRHKRRYSAFILNSPTHALREIMNLNTDGFSRENQGKRYLISLYLWHYSFTALAILFKAACSILWRRSTLSSDPSSEGCFPPELPIMNPSPAKGMKGASWETGTGLESSGALMASKNFFGSKHSIINEEARWDRMKPDIYHRRKQGDWPSRGFHDLGYYGIMHQ